MTDYIVTRAFVTLCANQADAPTSPALSLARKVNRSGVTIHRKACERNYSNRCEKFHKLSLWSIKRFVRNLVRLPRSLQCDLLISRSHCNEFRYLRVCIGGEAA
jgi:hypothetical protein